MRSIHSIAFSILLVCAFSAAPTAAAFACGTGADCCKKEAKTERKACCQQTEGHAAPCQKHKDCGGNCGDNGCPCPSHSTTCGFQPPALMSFEPSRLSVPDALTKADWYFLNKIPAAVYLSVWLPPKI